jgi:hypothetical protein
MQKNLGSLIAILAVGALSACTTIVVRPVGTPAPEEKEPSEPPGESSAEAEAAALEDAIDHNVGGDRYPDLLRDAFLRECVPQGGQRPCECVLGKMEAEYTVEDVGGQRVKSEDIERWTVDCLGASSSISPSPHGPDRFDPPAVYPQEVRDAFLNECRPNGGRATCECVLAKMEIEVPLARLARNDVPKELLEGWVKECLGQ